MVASLVGSRHGVERRSTTRATSDTTTECARLYALWCANDRIAKLVKGCGEIGLVTTHSAMKIADEPHSVAHAAHHAFEVDMARTAEMTPSVETILRVQHVGKRVQGIVERQMP